MKYDKNIYRIYLNKDIKEKYYHKVPYYKYKDINIDKSVDVVGKTKLKNIKRNKKQKTDLLFVNNKKYIVKNKMLGFTKGYISVGNNKYIEIKRKYFLLLLLLVVIFLLAFDSKEPIKKKIFDPVMPIIDDITEEEDKNVNEDNIKNKKIAMLNKEKLKNKFTIDYELNGGTIDNPIYEYVKGDNLKLPVPLKNGYEFEGWYLEKAFYNKIVRITKDMEENIVVYAKWKIIDYKINYNLNNGVLDNKFNSYNIETDDFIIDMPTRIGYKFLGWTSSSNKKPTKDIEIKKGTVGDISLVANWQITNYNLNYNLKGGTVDNPVNSYNVEDDSFHLKKPTKTGYSFMGWTNEDIIKPNKTVSIEKGTIGDLSFDANWRLRDFSIYYKLNGGVLDQARATYDIESEDFVIATPSKRGYDFMGWTGSNGSILNKEISIKKGTIGDLFLSANWRLEYYDIKYELNGGILENQIDFYTVESENFTIDMPKKRGYEFLGWSTIEDNSPKKEMTIKQGTVGNITLIANWQPIKYSINYNLNGGTLSNKVDIYTIESEDFTIGTPVRKGYDFIAWTKEDGTNESIITINKGTIGDISLVAKWRIRSHTVTYKHSNNSYYNSQRVNYNSQVSMLGYSVDSVHVFNGWLYNGRIIDSLAMPDNDITLVASVRETNCYLITGQAQDGDNTRIARFQELLAQKGLGGRWNLEATGYYDFVSNSSNYSHVLDAANHLVANAPSSSWPSLRWLYMTCDNGYGIQLR